MSRINRSYLIAAAIAVGAGAWVASGPLGLGVGDRADLPVGGSIAQGGNSMVAPGSGSAIAVRAQVIQAESKVSDVIVRGRTEALRSVDIKAEIDGRVIELPVEKGSTVTTGDVVCRLALNDLPALRVESRALVRQHRLEFKAAKALSSKGYRAETQLAAAAARLEGSKASVARIDKQIQYTAIRAPFDGVLNDRPAEIGDYLQKGGICGTVVDQDPFLVVGQVSEQDVGSITLGALGTAKLITGRTVFGKVRYISRTADPRTRTFRMELEVSNTNRDLRSGMTAEIRLPVKRVTAHYLSPALLTLDDDGRVGVRVVNGAGVAEFRPVILESEDNGGVWVSGLPATVTVITVGQDFVNDGQTLKVTLEDAPGAPKASAASALDPS